MSRRLDRRMSRRQRRTERGAICFDRVILEPSGPHSQQPYIYVTGEPPSEPTAYAIPED
jgi:hypothetical protein